MKKLQVRLINDSKTDIIIDNGIFNQLSSLLDSISDYTNFVIITDQNVYHHLYLFLLKLVFLGFYQQILLVQNVTDHELHGLYQICLNFLITNKSILLTK